MVRGTPVTTTSSSSHQPSFLSVTSSSIARARRRWWLGRVSGFTHRIGHVRAVQSIHRDHGFRSSLLSIRDSARGQFGGRCFQLPELHDQSARNPKPSTKMTVTAHAATTAARRSGGRGLPTPIVSTHPRRRPPPRRGERAGARRGGPGIGSPCGVQPVASARPARSSRRAAPTCHILVTRRAD